MCRSASDELYCVGVRENQQAVRVCDKGLESSLAATSNHKPDNGSKCVYVKCIMQVDSHENRAYRHRSPRSWRPGICLIAALVFVLCDGGFAEDEELHVYGDPAIRRAVDEQLKKLYELANGPGVQVELLTRDNPLQLADALAMELTASMAGNSASRIVGAVWTKQGKYSVEFYRAGDKLLMVYETFSFFMESAPKDTWRNFMGLAGWESRIYFDAQGEVGYAETHGREAPAPMSNGRKLQQQVARVSKLLAQSAARWERK